MTDKESDMFKIKKGTKQGDPLQHRVLQEALKTTFHAGKRKKGMRLCFGDCEIHCITNLWFADDVLLFAKKRSSFKKMMCDFKHSTEKVGVKIHPGKTKILSSQSSSRRTEMED